MRLLAVCMVLTLIVATTTAQRGGFFQALANLFGGGNNNNNNNNRQISSGSGSRYPQWLDTSDGRFSKFNGPVRGIPRDHGGGRFGAANCLLCPNGQ